MIQSYFKFLDLHKILPEGWKEEFSCYEIFDSIPSDKETEVICTNCNKATGKFLKQNQFAYRGERFFSINVLLVMSGFPLSMIKVRFEMMIIPRPSRLWIIGGLSYVFQC